MVALDKLLADGRVRAIVFFFELTADEIAQIDALDTGARSGRRSHHVEGEGRRS